MMQIVNRSQRRMNKKRFVLPLFVLAVASISFVLGVAVGRGRSGKLPSLPPATVPPPTTSAKATTKDLTFYDTLPKGEQVPLGSGINLPRESSASVDQAAAATGAGMTSTDSPTPAATPSPALQPTAPQANPSSSTQEKVVAPVPAIAPVAAPAGTAANGRWVIQVASYKTAEDARKMQEGLAGKGFRAAIREADLADKGKWFRVVLGPYPSDAEANQIASRLQNEGVTGLVRKD